MVLKNIFRKNKNPPELETLLNFLNKRGLDARLDKKTFGVPSIQLPIDILNTETEKIFGDFPVEFVKGVGWMNTKRVELEHITAYNLSAFCETFRRHRGIYPGYIIGHVQVGDKKVPVGLGNSKLYSLDPYEMFRE